jgi:hypothetical protein
VNVRELVVGPQGRIQERMPEGIQASVGTKGKEDGRERSEL